MLAGNHRSIRRHRRGSRNRNFFESIALIWHGNWIHDISGSKMNQIFLKSLLVILLCISNSFCVFRLNNEDSASIKNLDGYGHLGKFGFKEAWYGIYFQEDKVGYSHFRIEPSGDNFVIHSDSVMRLTALKKTNQIKMEEKVFVKPDLTLLSFESLVEMNDKSLEVKGRNESGKLSVNMTASGEKIERTYDVDGALYHSSAISLMPALRGLSEGASSSFTVFNPEKQTMETVDQLITKVSGAPGPNDAVWKARNKLGAAVVNSWLNRKGLTVLEKALDGSLITVLEDESLARDFLNKKAQQKDLILDLSLVKSPKPILKPAGTRSLSAVIKGVDPSLFPEDHRQKITTSGSDMAPGSFKLDVVVENRADFGSKKKVRTLSNPDIRQDFDREGDLASTLSIQSDNPVIVKQASSIVSPQDPDFERVVKLVNWTSDNIRKSMRDSFTALEVLQTMEGECQSHAGLYTAMARSLKIPTRIVTGLVYSDGLGFLYHAWAESYVDGWLSVDPTLKQTPSDATHIKIANNVDGSSSNAVLQMVGKLKIESIDYH